MIVTIIKNLNRGIILLNNISDEEYSDSSVAPYYTSIGSHMRHILDVFSCIFKGIESNQIIDFSDRERNELAQTKTKFGISYFHEIIGKLQNLDTAKFNDLFQVIDDLGDGKVSINYTLGSALAQAHSHAIHHFASVGFIISKLDLELPDTDFGYNPTTPRKKKVN